MYIITITEQPCNQEYSFPIIRDLNYTDYTEAERIYRAILELPFILSAKISYYEEHEYRYKITVLHEFNRPFK